MSFVSRNHPQQLAVRGALEEVDDRGTPPEVFDPLHKRFQFTIDVAAAPHNAKLPRYFTRADDGLTQSWAGERAWCNPPYSEIRAWVEKAWASAYTTNGTHSQLIVMLLPANRTEQGWWQDLIEPHRDQGRRLFRPTVRVEFLRGRTRFIRPGQTEIGANERPPFGCCLVIWGSA